MTAIAGLDVGALQRELEDLKRARYEASQRVKSITRPPLLARPPDDDGPAPLHGGAEPWGRPGGFSRDRGGPGGFGDQMPPPPLHGRLGRDARPEPYGGVTFHPAGPRDGDPRGGRGGRDRDAGPGPGPRVPGPRMAGRLDPREAGGPWNGRGGGPGGDRRYGGGGGDFRDPGRGRGGPFDGGRGHGGWEDRGGAGYQRGAGGDAYGRRGSDSGMAADDEPRPGSKRKLSSAVVVTGRDGQAADQAPESDAGAEGKEAAAGPDEAPAAPPPEDANQKKRARRMFGALLGTLQKCREEDKQFRATDAAQRRAELQRKAEERAAAESERLRREAAEERANQRRQELDRLMGLNLATDVKHLQLQAARRLAHRSALHCFLATSTGPTLYWLPVRHTPETEALLEAQKGELEAWKAEVMEELARETEAMQQRAEARRLAAQQRRQAAATGNGAGGGDEGMRDAGHEGEEEEEGVAEFDHDGEGGHDDGAAGNGAGGSAAHAPAPALARRLGSAVVVAQPALDDRYVAEGADTDGQGQDGSWGQAVRSAPPGPRRQQHQGEDNEDGELRVDPKEKEAADAAAEEGEEEQQEEEDDDGDRFDGDADMDGPIANPETVEDLLA